MSFFVSGTDTDIGKTFASSLVLRELSKHRRVTYFKPVQSGEPTDLAAVKKWVPNLYVKDSSYVFSTPASPDRAAAIQSVDITVDKIKKDWSQRGESFHLVEGAGGLCVPLNAEEQMIDLIQELDLPCLLVTSTRLGTINHTLLSVQALQRNQIPILGIVLNGKEDPGLKEILEEKTQEKVLFSIPHFVNCDSHAIDHWMKTDNSFQKFIEGQVGSKEKKARTSQRSLESLDREFVWHPFTQHGIVESHPVVTSARGSYLNINGRQVIDGISSWWVNLFGHCHPQISQAIHQQTRELEHVIFAGFSHQPAIQLSERLVKKARQHGAFVDKAFFSDNGSTAVEVALKMAFQFHQQQGHSRRRRFLAFKGSYHGDTLGAMSVGEREGFNDVFRSLMFDVDFVDPFDVDSLKKVFTAHGKDYAAVIFEPMVQGASGMRMYDVGVLNELEKLCNEYGVFRICDEVFTGFYRTGRCFAFEHSDLKPDFICLSKGLTGGFLPLALTLTSQTIFDQFHADDMRMAFLHGHSYTANPISCAAAVKTLDLLEENEFLEKLSDIEKWTQDLVTELMQTGKFFRGRNLGTIGAVEVSDEDPNYFKGDFSYKFNQAALKKGVLLRPLGGTLYSVPPYCIEKQELEKIYHTMYEVILEEF